MHSREYYHRLRDVFKPKSPELVFIAESPPASGKYFYDTSGGVTEPLFRAMMRDVLNISPQSKRDGLHAYQEAGYLLVDATYVPVNKGLTAKQRDAQILSDYPLLLDDLASLGIGGNTRIVLVKANICRLLDRKLSSDGFNVLNRGMVVPFPASGNQTRFRQSISGILG
jgi:hypothetical protein